MFLSMKSLSLSITNGVRVASPSPSVVSISGVVISSPLMVVLWVIRASRAFLRVVTSIGLCVLDGISFSSSFSIWLGVWNRLVKYIRVLIRMVLDMSATHR